MSFPLLVPLLPALLVALPEENSQQPLTTLATIPSPVSCTKKPSQNKTPEPADLTRIPHFSFLCGHKKYKNLFYGRYHSHPCLLKTTVSGRCKTIRNEIKWYQILLHDNILRPYVISDHFFIMPEYPYTLDDLIQKGQITGHLSLYCRVMKQLLHVVHFLHQQHIAHRDIKPHNILCNDQYHIYLADFEYTSTVSVQTSATNRQHQRCGTPNYVAPEIVTNKKDVDYLAHDVWAIGVTAYCLWFGKAPFETKTVQDTYAKIREVKYWIPTAVSCPTIVRQFITQVLVPKAKRPSLKQLYSWFDMTLDSTPHSTTNLQG